MVLPVLPPGTVTAVRRFVLNPEAFTGNMAVMRGEVHRHAAKVLRLKKGARILLSDGRGHEYEGTVIAVDRDEIRVELGEMKQADRQAGPAITIYQGLPKGDKIDLILQKGTELGAAAITTFIAERSVSKVAAEQRREKTERWQRIAAEAARQSGASEIPEVSLAMNLKEAIGSAGQQLKLLLWEEEHNEGLKAMVAKLDPPRDIGVLIGPEGGFSPGEVRLARERGFIPLTLGRRIVRTETASLVALAILQFTWGDIG